MDKSKLGFSSSPTEVRGSSTSSPWLQQLTEIKRKSESYVASLAQKEEHISELESQLVASQNQVENQSQKILGYERLKEELRHQVELSDAKAFSLKKDNINLNIELEEAKKEVNKWSLVASKKGDELEAAQTRIKELEKELEDMHKIIYEVNHGLPPGEESRIPDVCQEEREGGYASSHDDDEEDGAATDVVLQESIVIANFAPISTRTEHFLSQRNATVSSTSGMLPVPPQYKSEVVPSSTNSSHGTGSNVIAPSKMIMGKFKSEIKNNPASASRLRREQANNLNLASNSQLRREQTNNPPDGDDIGADFRSASGIKSRPRHYCPRSVAPSPSRQLRKRSKLLFYSILEDTDTEVEQG
ncbi:unnamed protein product [Orchesella dallaii]|uniref:Uncharacterized protein n=1 Tax=Orchesella dallaii TaxID=48710 RepID=A0ABP1S432_9HEXA